MDFEVSSVCDDSLNSNRTEQKLKVFIEAYDDQDRQILGNCDGQGVINAKNFRRTHHYKRLKNTERRKLSLNGRVAYYVFVTDSGHVLETIKLYNSNRTEQK